MLMSRSQPNIGLVDVIGIGKQWPGVSALATTDMLEDADTMVLSMGQVAERVGEVPRRAGQVLVQTNGLMTAYLLHSASKVAQVLRALCKKQC